MTIPEAVQLIIRSGSLAAERRNATSNGRAPEVLDGDGDGPRERRVSPTGAARSSEPCADVFVLDMGEPVRIIELARAMIELSGLDPDRDIEVEVVGRRPGEKLHEELFNPDERPLPTPAEKIVAASRSPFDPIWVEEAFARVEELVYHGKPDELAKMVSSLARERGLVPPLGARHSV
jgi:FlaA1/EpsC-like NDP-sugar epimerase